MRCSTARKRADGRGGWPRRPDRATARRRWRPATFSTLCWPRSCDLGQRADLLHVAVQPGRDPAVAHEHAVVERPPPAEPQHAGPRARGQGGGGRVVGVEHGAVGRRLVRGRCGPWPRRRPSNEPWRSRWSGVTFSTAATRGWKVSIVSSWKRRHLGDDEAVGRERRARATASGVPMLPATSTGRGCSASRAPVSAVVVVLPLVPVMAMVSASIARQPSSSSPMIGSPAARAGASCGRVERHAGTHDHEHRRRRTRPVAAGGEQAHAGLAQRRHLAAERRRAAWRRSPSPRRRPRGAGGPPPRRCGQPDHRHPPPGQRLEPRRVLASPRRSPRVPSCRSLSVVHGSPPRLIAA